MFQPQKTRTEPLPGSEDSGTARRVFLMLQGPHGPFFDRLGDILRQAGCRVWRCAFNAGDAFFWSDSAHLIRHVEGLEGWPDHLRQIVDSKGVTDIVLYGDIRPIHATARQFAAARGLRLHVFEEGYLRPYWITYEREGSNGNSVLGRITAAQMRASLQDPAAEIRRPPASWGDMRQHKFYGAFYHFLVLLANRRYAAYRGHRDIPVRDEFWLNLRRLLLTPALTLKRNLLWRRIRLSGQPYSLFLLQLEHDSSFRGHSDFVSNAEVIERVIGEFAASAPGHHHLIFKAHPLEDGRARNRLAIIAAMHRHGIAGRVHYLRGGKLADLLPFARSVVTVNSTAAQQALWRGLPVLALGRAVYCRPGLVSSQTLAGFFRHPSPPDARAYRLFRNYLLQTSQIPGGFYSRRSRSHALRLVGDLMLAPEDPYDSLARGLVSRRQQITEDFD
jgi:capsular polysaccharide export protein